MKKLPISALSFFVVLAVVGLFTSAGNTAESKSAPDVQIQIQPEKPAPGPQGPEGAPGKPGPQGAPGAPGPQGAPAPSASSGGSTILGMDSTVALLIGAVLILVVIVAIVAISKSGTSRA